MPLTKSVLGLSVNSIHYDYDHPRIKQSKLRKLKDKKFSKIFVFDLLEYEYCLFATLTSCVSRLDPGGLLYIEIPTNNNPKEDYKGRLHEFTDKSARCLSHNLSMNSQVNLNDNYATIYYSKGIDFLAYKEELHGNSD